MLILASKSPRRKYLLKQAGIEFTSLPADICEKSLRRRPDKIVQELACMKALWVSGEHPDDPVIGSDTLVYCRKEILGKPKDAEDALRMLKLQNGSWQSVYTGVALIWKARNIKLVGYDRARCLARKLPEEELKKIAAKHMDKAGAYAVQDTDDVFISKIEGSFDTIVGLPVKLVKDFMKQAGLPA